MISTIATNNVCFVRSSCSRTRWIECKDVTTCSFSTASWQMWFFWVAHKINLMQFWSKLVTDWLTALSKAPLNRRLEVSITRKLNLNVWRNFSEKRFLYTQTPHACTYACTYVGRSHAVRGVKVQSLLQAVGTSSSTTSIVIYSF